MDTVEAVTAVASILIRVVMAVAAAVVTAGVMAVVFRVTTKRNKSAVTNMLRKVCNRDISSCIVISISIDRYKHFQCPLIIIIITSSLLS